jgi:hypothetical protein
MPSEHAEVPLPKKKEEKKEIKEKLNYYICGC